MAAKKITPKLIKNIAECLRRGATIDASCKACNINRCTYYAWRKEAKIPANKPQQRFIQACEKAMAEYETELLEKITIHSSKTWQAAAWILERRFRDKFSQNAIEQDAAAEVEDESDDKFL